ncbi:MAG: hypothetical protein AAGJ40_09305 [Planctomycetota bacterium]
MRFIADVVLENGLDYLKQNVDQLILASAGTTTYADANTNNGTGSGVKILEVAIVPADITLEDGATDGRKATMAAKSSIAVTADGDADHVIWADSGNSAVLAVMQLTSALTGLTTSGAPVDINSHFAAIRDAVAAT